MAGSTTVAGACSLDHRHFVLASFYWASEVRTNDGRTCTVSLSPVYRSDSSEELAVVARSLTFAWRTSVSLHRLTEDYI